MATNFILLNNFINICTRNLIDYDITYSLLKKIAEPIFTALDMNNNDEKNQFLNNTILINFHRNVGMNFKRIDPNEVIAYRLAQQNDVEELARKLLANPQILSILSNSNVNV